MKAPDEVFIRYASTGRPLGSEAFIRKAEKPLNQDFSGWHCGQVEQYNVLNNWRAEHAKFIYLLGIISSYLYAVVVFHNHQRTLFY